MADGQETYLRVGIDATQAESGGRVVVRSLNDISSAADTTQSHLSQMKDVLFGIAGAAVGVYGVATAVQALGNYAKESLNYLGLIETSTLGIASSLLVSGNYIDTVTGKALKGTAALKAAQNESTNIIAQLRMANLETIATLDELIVAYQTTLPVAMSRGFNKQQVMDFTKTMVQAAGAIGLPFNQMAEETRSLLVEGAINPRNSRIATILGLRSSDIAEYKGNAQGLFDFLMGRLEGFAVAGEASMQTWKGLWSNVKDVTQQMSAELFAPAFDKIKAGLSDFMKNALVFHVDEAGQKTYTLNQNLINIIDNIKTMASIMYEAGKALAAYVIIYKGGAVLETIFAWVAAKNQLWAMEIKTATALEAGTAMTFANGEGLKVVAAESLNVAKANMAVTETDIAGAEAKLAVIRVNSELITQDLILNNSKLSGLAINAQVAASELAIAESKVASIRTRILERESILASIAGLEQERMQGLLSAEQERALDLAKQQSANTRRSIAALSQMERISEGELVIAKDAHAIAQERLNVAQGISATLIEQKTGLNAAQLVQETELTAAKLAHKNAQDAVNTATGRAAIVNAGTTASLWTMGTALNALMALWVGWEIGSFLNKFEVVRKAGVYMVYGIMGAWHELENMWARFKATANPFGDEEEQNERLKKIDKEYADWKLQFQTNLAEQLVDVTEKAKKKAEKPIIPPYVANPAKVDLNDKAQKEQDRIDKYNMAQQMTYEEEKRKIADAYSTQRMAVLKGEETAEQTALANKYNTFQMYQREYEQFMYESQDRISKAEIQKAQEHLNEMNKQFNSAKSKYEAQPSATNGQVEIKNDLRKKMNELIVKQTDAETVLYNLQQKGNDLSKKNEGRKEALTITEDTALAMMQANSIAITGNDEAATSLKNQIALMEIKNELIQAAQKEYNIAVDMNNLQKMQDANWMAKASQEATNPLGEFDNADAAATNALSKQLVANEIVIDSLNRRMKAEQDLQNNTNTTNDMMIASILRVVEIEKMSAIERVANEQKVAKIKTTVNEKYWQSSFDVAKKAVPQLAALDGWVAVLHKEYEKDKEDTTKKSMRGQMQMVSDYAGVAANTFSTLASQQDTSARSGFETAKAFNIAAAVMSTASGIMSAFAAPDNLTMVQKVAMAAMVGATGAIQIAKIASTSFGGGGTASNVSMGSFSGGSASQGGSVGGSIGSKITKATDAISEERLAQIAGSMENASLAIGRVADGLVKVADLFTTGSFMSLASGSLSSAKLAEAAANTKGMDWLKGGIDPISGMQTLVKAFMGSGQKFLKDSGITLGMQGGQVTAGNYKMYETKGGWFKSGSTSASFSDNPEFTSVMQNAMRGIMTTISRSAVAMGTSTDFSSATATGRAISTAGKTPEEVAKEVQKWMETASDALAKTVVGLQDFAFYGENAFDALTRLSISLQSTNEAFELVGLTLVDSSLAGANAAFKLQDAMGGAEAFAKKMDTYFTTFFTSAEQDAANAAQAQRQVNASFAELGIVGITTRAEFKALVEALDVTTAFGASMFASLMDIQDAFALVTEAANKAATSLVTSILDVSLAAANMLKDIYSGSLSMKSPTVKYNETKQAYLDAVSSGNTAAIPELAKALLDSSRGYNASGTAYQSDYAMVTAKLEELAGGSGGTLTEIQKQIKILEDIRDNLATQNNAQLSALAGLLGTNSPLYYALQAYLQQATMVNVSMSDTIKAMQIVDVQRRLSDANTNQTAAQAEYDRIAANKAAFVTSGTNAVIAGVITLSQYNAVLDSYIGQMNTANEALQATKDIVAGLTAQLAALQAVPPVTTIPTVPTPTTPPVGQATYSLISGHVWDDEDEIYYDIWKNNLTGIEQWLVEGSIPSFAKGTSSVPYDMMANIHANEIVMDAQSADVLRRYGIPMTGSSDSGTVERLEQLLKESQAQTRVLQEGLARLIEAADKNADNTEVLAGNARLEAAK